MKNLLFIGLFFLSPFPGNLFQEKLVDYLKQNQTEKIYLHLDKKYYGSGDIIWFKAYLINATTHLPSEISGTIHIELVNSEGEVMQSELLRAESGLSHGQIKLPKSTPSGVYQIRAYTNWMLNFSHEFIFKRNFEVINSALENSKENYNSERKIKQVDFLPEGGDLIAGIGTKLGISAYDSLGHGLATEGVIKNEQNEPVATFQTNRLGKGLSFLTPKSDKKYYAEINGAKFSLPEVKQKGASITVTHRYESDDIIVSIISKGVSLTNGHLVAHRRGEPLFTHKNVNEASFATKLRKQDLGTGMIHLTYFNDQNIPLCERLIYPNIPTLFNNDLEIKPNAESYSKRSKVQLNIKIPQSLHSASLVVNPKQEQHFTENDESIISSFMLTSDLKGRIDSPGSYFMGTKEAYKAMDMLMLTNGWSRFKWEDILAGKGVEKTFPIEKGITIKGQLVGYYDQTKTRKGTIKMTTTNNGVKIAQGITNEDGKFIISDNIFEDSTRVILEATGFNKKGTKEDDNVSINLTLPKRPKSDPYLSAPDVIDNFEQTVSKQAQIRNAYFLDDEASFLDEVVVKGRRIDERVEQTRRYLEPDSRIILDSMSFSPAGSVIDLLRNVSGVVVSGYGQNQSVTIRGISSINGSSSPLFVLDNVPVDISAIRSLPVQQVDFVDVLKGTKASIYGIQAAGGAVLVYTKKGESLRAAKKAKGLLVFTHPGYHQSKEFYSPNYEIPEESHSIPDYRSTLFWEPNISPGEEETQIQFYSSDQDGVFDVRIEGLMKDGTPFVERSSFTVE
ncbi:TonB-dependent receptor plug domain-containing protein [Ekhidna sp.]|uniref:TonB-dependent receptor n=1 Tax=Ekhidna sp. TaxID=2608089 RepID=UPI003CCC0143